MLVRFCHFRYSGPHVLVEPKENDAIDISIVVAAYNEQALLPRCLESIAVAREATDARVEVIVVDNGSTDDTATIAHASGARVVTEPRLGAVHAKCAGVRSARGAIIAVLDADSVCPADWLTRIAHSFSSQSDLVGVTGPARYTGGRFWAPAFIWFWYAWWRVVACLAGRAVYAVGTNVAFRREAYLRSDGFDLGVLVGGDEISLFSSLAKVGRTSFDVSLVVETDARRVNIGLLRFLWEVFFLHYVVNYTYYRITGRSLMKHYRPGSTLSRSS